MLTTRLSCALACAGWLALSGCAAQHRSAAGATVAFIGGGAAVAGISIATGCYPDGADDDDPSRFATSSTNTSQSDAEPNPAIGVPTLLVGLTLAVIGGILYGTATKVPHAPPVAAPSVRPGPSPAPTF